MNDPDKALHDAELSNLYQQSRIDEPPMALDSAILTQARQAVEKPARKPLWRRIGWRMPLATVAIAMLTVSLFLQMKQEQPELLAPAPQEMLDVSPMQEGAMMDEDAPAPKRERGASSLQKESKKSLGELAPKAMQVAPSSVSGAATEPPASGQMLKPQDSPGTASTLMHAPAAADSLATGAASEKRESDAGLASPEAEIENWLQDIRQLIREGKLDEAKGSLNAFRDTYPEYSVPEEIASTLK